MNNNTNRNSRKPFRIAFNPLSLSLFSILPPAPPQALELNTSDVNALVARSKCYLLLGEPDKALHDAETALLSSDKNNIRAIYQKAEALYFLGQFEYSLMFFHRGLRLRPELNTLRLGVQKTQEAIENTIGVAAPKPKPKSKSNNESGAGTSRISTAVSSAGRTALAAASSSGGGGGLGGVTDHHHHRNAKPATSTVASVGGKAMMSKADHEKKASRRLLGELCVDKMYLENLLTHKDLKRADTDTEQISALAKDAVTFLNNREEFWRQQRPCTALMAKRKNVAGNNKKADADKWF